VKGITDMAVMDEFKDERSKMKDAPFKQRLAYFWDYYKWYVIGGLAGIIIVCVFVHDIVSQKTHLLSAALLNTSAYLDSSVSEEYEERFLDELGVDKKKYDISMDTSFYLSFENMDTTSASTIEKLSAYIAATMLDVMAADDTTFYKYANNGTLCDIREFLSEEQIEKYTPYFYYVDEKVVEQVQYADEQMDDSLRPEIPDPAKPELMEEPVPVGIYVDSCTEFLDTYDFTGADHVVIGVISNAPHTETIPLFIDYIFE
jgi:hypothetical protein